MKDKVFLDTNICNMETFKIEAIKAVIRYGEQSGFVAECLELPIVTQGRTLDEVTHHLREAIALHLEGEDLSQLGIAVNSPILVTFEIPPLYAQA